MKSLLRQVPVLCLMTMLSACNPSAPSSPSEEMGVDAFIAGHWPKVLPAQGEPPANFSHIEASLAPASCGTCHAEQYAQWQTSLHSHTMGSGIQWQLQLMSQDQGNRCLRCHAPLAEQKALVARDHNWPAQPASAPPDWIPPDLHDEGLVCAACHVRGHQRFGPPAKKPTADALPHNGFVSSDAFEDSRFCAACHQHFEDDNPPMINGKFLEDTWNQWGASQQARDGVQCQGCHMPERQHLWKGIHDPDMTLSAVDVTLDVTLGSENRAAVDVSITNSGAAHHFPTYMVPKVDVVLVLQSKIDNTEREILRHTIGWTVNVELTEEISDTRLAGGESWETRQSVAMPDNPDEWQVVLRMDVAPREHYERTFKNSLRYANELPAPTLAMLREAIAEAEATRYRLLERVSALPLRTVAN